MIQEGYERILEGWGYSERAFFVITIVTVHTVVYWGLGLFYLLSHHFNLFPKYKLNNSPVKVTKGLIKECFFSILFSHSILQLLLVCAYDVFVWRGMKISGPTPSIAHIIAEVVLSFAINDSVFYWLHRALHHPLLYARYHKKHHVFKNSIGINAEFASPVEYLFANAFPTLIGPLILQSHHLTILVYLALRFWETVESHSGYHLPWSVWSLFDWQAGARFHDYHHSHNIGNYGGVCSSFWDSLFHTNSSYLLFLSSSSSSSSPSSDRDQIDD